MGPWQEAELPGGRSSTHGPSPPGKTGPKEPEETQGAYINHIPRAVAPLCGEQDFQNHFSDHLPMGDFCVNFKLFSFIPSMFSRARDCIWRHPARPFVYLKVVPRLVVLTVDQV